jgi:hypothetical protein
MPKPAAATNKTEFQRYLNAHPNSVPTLLRLATIYSVNPHGKHTFGFWLRVKHRPVFDTAYSRFWLRNPKLYGVIYTEPEPTIR